MPKTRTDNPLNEDRPPVFGEQEQAAERRRRPARERQHPALYGEPDTEIAERTADVDAEPRKTFVKDFVTLRRDYDSEDHDAVHARNVNAVRQYMVNQGLRPDADVQFVGESDLGGPAGRESVALRYEVKAVPASIATAFDVRHTVIPQTGETATDRAEHDARREERLKAGHDAVREGTPEAERPHAAASREKRGRS